MKPLIGQRNRRSYMINTQIVPVCEIESDKQESLCTTPPAYSNKSQTEVLNIKLNEKIHQIENIYESENTPLDFKTFEKSYELESQDCYSKFSTLNLIKKGLQEIDIELSNKKRTLERQEIKKWIVKISARDCKLSFPEILKLDEIFMRFSKRIKERDDEFVVPGYCLKLKDEDTED